MKVSVNRFANNPLLTPRDLRPSRPDFEVTCVLNPGAFRFGNRIGLLLRVAERPVQDPECFTTPILEEDGTISILRFRRDDPGLSCVEARSFVWNGRFLLTTMSHLLPAWSDDGGRTFTPDYNCRLFPALPCESYGIEDARVEEIDGEYLLTFTAVGPAIVATEMTKAMGSSSSVHPKMLLGRLVQPEEIGAAVAFLASDEAAMITGQALFVDEGWSIH